MTEHKKPNVRDEPWFKNAPDWMGECIARICDTQDSQELLAQKLNHWETIVENRELVMDEREKALLSAVEDLKSFANKMYGPDSEITRIHRKLEKIEEFEKTQRAFESNQTEMLSKITEIGTAFEQLKGRVAELEKSRKSA